MKYNYIPSLSQLCTSLKYRSKEYLLENTLHGVPYFMNSSRPKWERIVWFITTMVSMCTTIWIIITIWDKFQKEPTLSEMDTFTANIKIDFPQVFLCLDWSQLNISSLNKTETDFYKKIYNWQWGNAIKPLQDELKNKKNFRHIFQLLTPDCSVSYNHCTFSGREEPCSKSLIKIITPVGACCKFNATKALTIADPPWAFSFVPLIYPFKLYLMGKMDVGPQRNEKPLHVIHEPTLVKIMASITYATAELRYLTQQQRQCHYKGEASSVNNCELHCQSVKILEGCGCVPWFLTLSQQECPLARYSCANSNYANTVDCNCLLSCNNTVYNCYKIANIIDDSSNATIPNKACEIAINEWPNAIYKRKIRFGHLDLLVSFGGIAGLFLGYSIMTSFEFIYYFSLKVYCGAVMDTFRKNHNIKVYVIKPKSSCKLDVTPVYYNYID